MLRKVNYQKHSGLLLLYPYLALIAWMPLPLGGKYPWAISIAEVWCYLIALAIIIDQIRYRTPLSRAFKTARFALILLGLNLLWVLFQCLPLPLPWLDFISPLAAAWYHQDGIDYAPISLDVATTLYHFQTAAFLLIFFCISLYLIDTRKKLQWLVYTVLISALVQVIYGALMVLTGIEYSFFISKTAMGIGSGRTSGTFANADHLAAYLEMALSLGIGYMLTLLSTQQSEKSWRKKMRAWSSVLLGPKARLRLILVLLCLGLVLTFSRGGNLGFFISLGVAGVLFLLFAQKKPRATIFFLISLIVLDVIIIGSWVGFSRVITRLEETSIKIEHRDDAYLATLPMTRDYFITGIGSGNYFSVFPNYKTPPLSGYWDHAHNDYLELLVEQGVVGFSLLVGVVLCAFFAAIQTLRRRKSSFLLGMSFAPIMGIIALLVHSGVDFSLQRLANSSLFMLLLSIAFICRHHQSPKKLPEDIRS